MLIWKLQSRLLGGTKCQLTFVVSVASPLALVLNHLEVVVVVAVFVRILLDLRPVTSVESGKVVGLPVRFRAETRSSDQLPADREDRPVGRIGSQAGSGRSDAGDR